MGKISQSGGNRSLEEYCAHCSEDERVGNGQSGAGTAPQMLLWGLAWREKMNELTPSTKSRGSDERRTPERKDTEELKSLGKRHSWQGHPLCRYQQGQSAQGSTGATRRLKRRREHRVKTKLSAKNWAKETRGKRKEWLVRTGSPRRGEQRRRSRKRDERQSMRGLGGSPQLQQRSWSTPHPQERRKKKSYSRKRTQ